MRQLGQGNSAPSGQTSQKEDRRPDHPSLYSLLLHVFKNSDKNSVVQNGINNNSYIANISLFLIEYLYASLMYSVSALPPSFICFV